MCGTMPTRPRSPEWHAHAMTYRGTRPYAEELPGAAPNLDVQKVREILTAIPTLEDAGKALIAPGMLEPRTVRGLGTIGRSAAQSYDETESQSHPPRQLGVFGRMREVKDPDVNRALDFLLRVAES